MYAHAMGGREQNSGDLGIINLQGAGEIAVTDARKKKKNCFIITTPQRTYYITAESQREMESWISELIAERDRVQGRNKPAEPAAAATDSGSSSASSSAGGGGSGAVRTPSRRVQSIHSASGIASEPTHTNAVSRHTQTPGGAPDKVGIDDFELLTVIGKGSFGKVR